MPRQAKLVYLVEAYGFDRIEVGRESRCVWWKQLDDDRHMTIEPSDSHKTAFPDFKHRHAVISIYRGTELMRHLEHQETAYIADDLRIFLKEHFGEISEAEQGDNNGN